MGEELRGTRVYELVLQASFSMKNLSIQYWVQIPSMDFDISSVRINMPNPQQSGQDKTMMVMVMMMMMMTLMMTLMMIF